MVMIMLVMVMMVLLQVMVLMMSTSLWPFILACPCVDTGSTEKASMTSMMRNISSHRKGFHLHSSLSGNFDFSTSRNQASVSMGDIFFKIIKKILGELSRAPTPMIVGRIVARQVYVDQT